MVILVAVAIISGFVVDKFMGKRNFIEKKGFSFDIHNVEHKECVKDNIRLFHFKFSWLRMLAISILAFFIITPIIGFGGHEHQSLIPNIHEHNHKDTLGWVDITLLICSSIGLLICLTCSEHFLKEHFINHLLKKHLPKIFLWTVIALVIIQIFMTFTDINVWINQNLWIILIVAVLVGFIPESGPHILFLSLYLSGAIPISILIANSIVQDGHGALPLFAESKKSFFMVKLINMGIGLLIGSIGLLTGI